MAGKKQKQENKVIDILTELASSVTKINQRLDKVEEVAGTQTATVQTAKVLEGKVEPEEFVDETAPEKKCSPRYRKLVDDILGEQFGAYETYDDTNASYFRFNIIVPTELSSISKSDKSKGLDSDVRSRSIANAVGENGVREWCQLVRKNLNKYYQLHAITSPFKSE